MTQANPLQLNTSAPDYQTQFQKRLHLDQEQDAQIEQSVKTILADIKKRGDAALIEYTNKYDQIPAKSIKELSLSQEELKNAYDTLPQDQKNALTQAAERIKNYHQWQKEQGGKTATYTDQEGTLLGQQITPIDKAGIYVPGGKAAYPSSVLMNAIPAHVAGVGEITMVVPTPRGEKNQLVLAAAHISGITKAYTIGGAQAIAALAYGTQTINKVDKITGPGNAYVASAKKHVFGQVGIDMIAGPSEILIIADEAANPDWIAIDLFSQAEHDELAQSILLCPSAEKIQQVQNSINKLLPQMPRAQIIAQSLNNRGLIIQTKNLEQACEIANQIAPEHLEIATQDPEKLLPQLKHAGAIFLGTYTSESLGDYCAGPNHVLPTSGTAKFSSPLSVYDFQKRTSLIKVSHKSAQTLGKIAQTLATGEGLQAHALAAQMRLD